MSVESQYVESGRVHPRLGFSPNDACKVRKLVAPDSLVLGTAVLVCHIKRCSLLF